MQIFDSEGKYKRQFGTKGHKADGQFDSPAGLASDAHGNLLVVDFTNRLQVFSPAGKHLCTRSDLGLHGDSGKGIAWSADGGIAVVESTHLTGLVFCVRPCTTAAIRQHHAGDGPRAPWHQHRIFSRRRLSLDPANRKINKDPPITFGTILTLSTFANHRPSDSSSSRHHSTCLRLIIEYGGKPRARGD
jgi:hypothetical protein